MLPKGSWIWLFPDFKLKNSAASSGESPKFKEDFFILNVLANPAASSGECTRCEFSGPEIKNLLCLLYILS